MTTTPSGLETLATFSEEEGQEALTANHVEVIETVIASLEQEQSAMVSRGDEGFLWKFRYGSVEVFVRLTGTTDEDLLTV